MNSDGYKIVEFSYCSTCKHVDLKEEEHPCATCLSEPVNLNSHKPVKWEEKV